jgi:MMP 1-O-methyltransferase
MRLPVAPESIKGFLDPDEGARLYALAMAAAALGPCLEVGSYCGKSTLYLGAACREHGQQLFAIDHHRGSEEHQPGEEYHDPDLLDPATGRIDSFRAFRATLARAGLEDTVIPVVAPSALAGRHWHTPLALVFIDGGHSRAAALTDYRTWARARPAGRHARHPRHLPRSGGRRAGALRNLSAGVGLRAVRRRADDPHAGRIAAYRLMSQGASGRRSMK